jgi:hypothetical protein
MISFTVVQRRWLGAFSHGSSRFRESDSSICHSHHQAFECAAGESDWRCAWSTDSEIGDFDWRELASSNAGVPEKAFRHDEICIREAEETRYWLDLLTAAEVINASRLSALHDECSQLIAILTSTVKLAKNSLRKSNRSS